MGIEFIRKAAPILSMLASTGTFRPTRAGFQAPSYRFKVGMLVLRAASCLTGVLPRLVRSFGSTTDLHLGLGHNQERGHADTNGLSGSHLAGAYCSDVTCPLP